MDWELKTRYGQYGYSERPTYSGPTKDEAIMSGAAGGAKTGGSALMSTGNPYAMIAGGIMQAGGMGMELAGTIQAAERAEEEFQKALEEYEWQKHRLEEIDEQTEEQLELQNMMTEALYAQSMEDRGRRDYGGYSRMIGR